MCALHLKSFELEFKLRRDISWPWLAFSSALANGGQVIWLGSGRCALGEGLFSFNISSEPISKSATERIQLSSTNYPQQISHTHLHQATLHFHYNTLLILMSRTKQLISYNIICGWSESYHNHTLFIFTHIYRLEYHCSLQCDFNLSV